MGFRLSVSQLPAWAQKKVTERPSIAKSISARELGNPKHTGGTEKKKDMATSQPAEAQGRWAQVSEESY